MNESKTLLYKLENLNEKFNDFKKIFILSFIGLLAIFLDKIIKK